MRCSPGANSVRLITAGVLQIRTALLLAKIPRHVYRPTNPQKDISYPDRTIMSRNTPIQRRDFLTMMLAGTAFLRLQWAQAQEAAREIFLERAAEGTPHKGKVLLAVQAHSDDLPLHAAGTVAKLVKEGYTGHLVRATNDDMGDDRKLGTRGTIGENVLRNERDNDELARVLGLKRVFNLNYGNHRMGDVSQNELQCRLIFLIRLLKVDTVVC